MLSVMENGSTMAAAYTVVLKTEPAVTDNGNTVVNDLKRGCRRLHGGGLADGAAEHRRGGRTGDAEAQADGDGRICRGARQCRSQTWQ